MLFRSSFLMSQLLPSGGQSIGASASILPSEYSAVISFRIDWFDFLSVQGICTRASVAAARGPSFAALGL